MNKLKKFFVLMMTVMSFSIVCVNAAPVTLQVGAVDPTVGQGGPSRGPVLVPEVSLEDYTLTFPTSCYGYTLELTDEDGEVAYTTIINSTTVNLPSTLSGTYELRLIPSDGSSIYFFGFVLF